MSMPIQSKTSFQVKVSSRGTITLPKKLRERNQIHEGSALKLIALDNNVVILQVPKSIVEEIADKLSEEWRTAGVSLESMLETLQ